jgi:hypothetical protein
MTYLIAFVASFAFVGLRATQQLNVVHGNRWLIIPTSCLMACCEVFTIGAIAVSGWGWIVLPVGVGAGLGCLAAMYTHKRFVRTGDEE